MKNDPHNKTSKKHPDLNELAKSIVDQATDDNSDEKSRPDINKTAFDVVSRATKSKNTQK